VNLGFKSIVLFNVNVMKVLNVMKAGCCHVVPSFIVPSSEGHPEEKRAQRILYASDFGRRKYQLSLTLLLRTYT
jgi:hypothetical protein